MRFVLYPLLGLLAGAVVGAVGGFIGGALIYERFNPACLEGTCGLAGVQAGAGFMVLLGLAGAAFGLWRALLHRRRNAAD